MDARCYSGSKGRTRYKKMKLGYRDLIATLLVAVVVGLIVYFNQIFVNIL